MARLNESLNYESKYITDGVLNNHLGIRNTDKLEEIERKITGLKLGKLFLEPREHIVKTEAQKKEIEKLKKASSERFDVEHYLAIHDYLFYNIYDFSGQIRDENIKKQIPFCLPNLIYSNLDYTLNQARKLSTRIKTRDDLVDFITELYPELDVIHPFREGNGRVEREFIRQYTNFICKNNSLDKYTINYDLIDDKDSFIKAIIIADARCDTTYLREFIDVMVVDCNEKNDISDKKR